MQNFDHLNENFAYSMIEGLLIKAQKAPAYSPDFDKIISKINDISLPKWRSNNYMAKIQTQNHTTELDHIIKTASPPKQSFLSRMFARKDDNLEHDKSAQALDLIHSYCDNSQVSMRALKREANEIKNYISSLKSADSLLSNFKNHLPSRLSEPKLSSLMFAVEEKKKEIADTTLIYQNALLAHTFAADCLEVGISNANLFRQALNLHLKVKKTWEPRANRIKWELEKSKPTRGIDKNIITRKDSNKYLQKITKDVKASNERQKNAITEMFKHQK